MRTKLFPVLLLVFIISVTAFSQAINSTVPGASNYYESLFGTVSPGRGANDALVYVDYTVGGNDGVIDGLNNLGFSVTIASNWTDFNAQLATGNFGLAVGFNQNIAAVGPSPSVVQNFIDNGGCMVFCDWYRSSTLANIFDASYAGSVNSTSFIITDAIMLNGISNPVVLSNPGWTTFSMDLSPMNGGEVLATFSDGTAAAIRGNGGKTIILGYLSDTPPVAERQQLFENVVSATVCGGAPGIPLADWAIFLGLFLIATFVVVRFVKTR